MTDAIDILQLITIPIITANIVILFCWANRDTKRILWAVAVGAWLFNALLFYIYVQVVNFFPDFPKIFSFTAWSAVLRAQSYIVILAVSITINKLNGKLDHDGN